MNPTHVQACGALIFIIATTCMAGYLGGPVWFFFVVAIWVSFLMMAK